MGDRHIQDVIHLLMALAHRKPAHRIAVQIHLPDGPGMFHTDFIHNTALVDAE